MGRLRLPGGSSWAPRIGQIFQKKKRRTEVTALLLFLQNSVFTELRKVFVFEPHGAESPFFSHGFTISQGDIGSYDDVHIMEEKTGT